MTAQAGWFDAGDKIPLRFSKAALEAHYFDQGGIPLTDRRVLIRACAQADMERSDLVNLIAELMDPDEPDLGMCPYLLQDGSEGAYGPNTCMGGCVDEPACDTGCPENGWPSNRARAVLAEWNPDKYGEQK